MARKLRIGIIGCGGIANAKHMPSLAKLDTVELAAFANRTRDKARLVRGTRRNSPPKTRRSA